MCWRPFDGRGEKWFGFHPRPQSKISEYHLWRKLNDTFYDDKYVVRSKKAPIEVKRTGELASSPSDEGNVSANRYNRAREKIDILKKQYRLDEEAGAAGAANGGEEAGVEEAVAALVLVLE